nr:hypothetical protein [Pantoea ananatis]
MATSVSSGNKPCKPPEFRKEALKLADRIGVAATARELSLYESSLNTGAVSRRVRQRALGVSVSVNRLEIARLKRQLDEQDEEPGYPPKGRDMLREAPEMKYVFIENFSIKAIRSALQFVRSGWYTLESASPSTESPATVPVSL